MIETKFIQRIAEELELSSTQVNQAIELLNGGATIPFIARYRKDATGNLDEVQLEAVADRNTYFIALTDRRDYVLTTLAKQGNLTEELRKQIDHCFDKTGLEDLYLPFKKRRRTRATVAREKGLLSLADFLWEQEPGGTSIEEFAATFARVEKAVGSVEDALAGARDILAELLSVDRDTRVLVRERMLKEGRVLARPTKNAEGQKTKYENYYDFSQTIHSIPSHRFLAILRGVKEGYLRMEFQIDDENTVAELLHRIVKEPGSPFEPHIRRVVEDGYSRLLRPSIENEVSAIVRSRADDEAIRVFRENAENLLLAPPAGHIPVVGLDPGLRTGCKLAVVDKAGVFIESAAIFPAAPGPDNETAESTLLALMAKHEAYAVAIGNGTGSREAATFVRDAIRKITGQEAFCVFVNEAGASVYSASRVAREEFPDLDVSVRGAISIARRVQDPLAELVKIEPRHIGVGQYQHDVNQKRLREGLHRTVVSCVNRVGVELNTASAALLRYVSGIQPKTAENIVAAREGLSGFKSREQLLDVDGVGVKVFEQSAGFLRIPGGDNPLDATSIHPEAYPVVDRLAETLNVPVTDLVGNAALLEGLDLSPFETETVGPRTLEDIRRELAKPGRDPRTDFKVPKFLESIHSVDDLEEGMVLEGVVTNVTDFGAFIDVGVHQDGLVHLSELANRFVRDPRSIAKVGEIVKVKVLKVDKELPRISLSMKAVAAPSEARPRKRKRRHREGGEQPAADAATPQASPESTEAAPHRPRQRRPERPARGRRQHKARVRQGAGERPAQRQKHADSGGPLNTQLADQLAALKEKLGS